MEWVEGGCGGGGGVSPVRWTGVHGPRPRVHGPCLARRLPVFPAPRCMKTTLVPRNTEGGGAKGETKVLVARYVPYSGVRSIL